jgi:hypothetical protein
MNKLAPAGAGLKKTLPLPLGNMATSLKCWVYDLDGTLVVPNFQTDEEFLTTNIKDQKFVLHIWDMQPWLCAGVVLTYRPRILAQETLEQLEPYKELIHTVYMRDLQQYPHYDEESVIEYKLHQLLQLSKLYAEIEFYEDKLAVCKAVKRDLKNKVKVFHVEHTEEGVRIVEVIL